MTSGSPKLQARAIITRQKMFDATARILSLEGYAAWNEEYLCKLCDCTRGAFRYNFPNGRYDLFPAFIESIINKDIAMISALSTLGPADRMYLFLLSMQLRPPSAETRALLEVSMAARGDKQLLALIDPLLKQADERILGITENDRSAEILALRSVLHGVSLYGFQPGSTAEGLSDLIAWLLKYLPVPPAIAARASEMTQARKNA
jgi:AcrR family transcriptional regulator